MTVAQEPTLLSEIIKSQGSISNDVQAMRSDLAAAVIDLAVIKAGNTTVTSEVADHEARIRRLEQFRYTIAGMAIVFGVAAGVVTNLIATHIH